MNAVFTLPNWRDPRYMQASIHFLYALVARVVFNFESSISNLFITLAYCLLLDTVISRLCYKQPNHILTSAIVAFGCSIMLYSPSIWIYIGAVSCAILAKAFIRFQGRHIFNPSNFGVVCMLALFPNWAVTSGNLFSNYWGPSLMFLALGTLNAWWSKQLRLAYTWLFAFCVFNYLRGIMFDAPFPLALLILNPLTLIFTFHMITDPATTPRTPWLRYAHPIAVAFLDSVLRQCDVV